MAELVTTESSQVQHPKQGEVEQVIGSMEHEAEDLISSVGEKVEAAKEALGKEIQGLGDAISTPGPSSTTPGRKVGEKEAQTAGDVARQDMLHETYTSGDRRH